MQTTRHQAAEHWVSWVVAVEGKAGDVRLATGRGQGPVHRLDDVATNLEFAKRLFKARLKREASRGYPFGQAQAFELGGSAKQQAA
jgi:hypothetical protein